MSSIPQKTKPPITILDTLRLKTLINRGATNREIVDATGYNYTSIVTFRDVFYRELFGSESLADRHQRLMTFDEIGSALGVSRNTAKRIYDKALEKLFKICDERGIDPYD